MKMKNAPNIKFLPKDKFTEAIIFAGEDAYSHVQHWIESEGKRAWDDVPPVYLGKRQLAELERLNIVDNGRRSVRVIRAGELSEMQISTIATKLALADVKEARLFNGMFEPQPKEDWTGRLPRLKEEAERGESIVVNLPVKKRSQSLNRAMNSNPAWKAAAMACTGSRQRWTRIVARSSITKRGCARLLRWSAPVVTGQSAILFCAGVLRVVMKILPGRSPVLISVSATAGAHLKLVG